MPSVSLRGLKMRARLYTRIREFFAARNVLEVETPIVNRYTVTDPYIDSMIVDGGRRAYLHTSPEYTMKRLLAFFKCDIYQLCKVFRAAEKGRHHHPEFTMLEWYRVGWSYHELMREVDDLVKNLVKESLPGLAETLFITYRDAFENYCGLDPRRAAPSDYVRVGERAMLSLGAGLSIREYQDLFLDQIIAPRLPTDRLTFIHRFPAQQAALAELGDDGMAERFELYLGNVELANGFQELTDAQEQLRRFEEDHRLRRQADKDCPDIDPQFVASLSAGLPECAGVALGVDRLLMILLGVKEIKRVLAFA